MPELMKARSKRPARADAASAPPRGSVRQPQPAQSEPNIGGRLRHARLMRNLNLKDVADLSNCSESFISKLENNKVKPSFAMLHRIAGALEVSVASLLESAPSTQHPRVMITSASGRAKVPIDDSALGALELLTPRGSAKLLQANIHHVEPGGGTNGMIQQDGEALGYVLSGEIEFIVSGASSRLKTGDSFVFPAELPHGYHNDGRKAARILWINTPPDV